jgi:HPt (histidine-containing phosphotransfer) domain-containing protein
MASGLEAREASLKPIDLGHLERHTLGDRALQREVLALFRGQSLADLARMRAARSVKEWKEAAHSLKGSARAIGAWRAAACAERAEAGDGGLDQRRAHHVAEIETALREVHAHIATLLEDTDGAA